MPAPLRVAVVGLGRIAREQHLPALAGASGMVLVATVDPRAAPLPGVPCLPDLATLLREGPVVDAVALCTPPQGRHLLAATALRAGCHVLLEKPPGATVGEAAPLLALARDRGRTLFAAWHSRLAPGVEPARRLLARLVVRSVEVVWREDVRRWHPGQAWIWEPGGLGVFDPGINALSILTRILPHPPFLTEATLWVPANRATPIAARLGLADAGGMTGTVELDWRQEGPQTWEIRVETEEGPVLLEGGGRRLVHAGQVLVDAVPAEYAGLYRHLAGLITAGESEMDLSPLGLVADAFLLGRRHEAASFEE